MRGPSTAAVTGQRPPVAVQRYYWERTDEQSGMLLVETRQAW